VKSNTSSVIKKMTDMDGDPLDFNDLVAAWNKLCEQSWAETSGDFQFADIESAAVAALSDQVNEKHTGSIGNEISRMLSTFDYPTFLVTTDGRIAAINLAASLEFELTIGDKIDQLPYKLQAAENLSVLVGKCLQAQDSATADALLKRAYGENNEREATIAITASMGRVPTALVFVISTQWKPSSTKLLKSQFDLTDTEAEILINFVDGYSTQDIATHRDRSHATVRTQLQSVLTKTGARNQTELLRIALSVSNFVKDIGVITDAVNHPYRRQAEIFREGGRLIEVTLMGNLTGTPILTVAGPSVYTCNADIEQALHESGLYVISVCTPGCGKTDPVPVGAERMSYICQDISAILDQLKIDRCAILALTNNSPICYALTSRLPERFSHVVQMSACVPLKYSEDNTSQSPWLTGILRASNDHPAMKTILLKGAIKAWATIGARQFIRLQLSSNPVDAEYAFRAENLAENEHALKTATMGGISAVVEDISLSFGDWSDDIEASPVNITIMHGEHDHLFPIEGVRAFASHFSHKAKLLEIPNAGFTFIQKKPTEVIQHLKKVVESYS